MTDERSESDERSVTDERSEMGEKRKKRVAQKEIQYPEVQGNPHEALSEDQVWIHKRSRLIENTALPANLH